MAVESNTPTPAEERAAKLIVDTLDRLGTASVSHILASLERGKRVWQDPENRFSSRQVMTAIPREVRSEVSELAWTKAQLIDPPLAHIKRESGVDAPLVYSATKIILIPSVLVLLIGMVAGGDWQLGWYIAAAALSLPALVFFAFAKNLDQLLLFSYRVDWAEYVRAYLYAQLSDEAQLDDDAKAFRLRLIDTING